MMYYLYFCGMAIQSLVGKKIGRWLVIERSPNGKYGEAKFLCRCDCGIERVVLNGSLMNGESKSCGCYIRDYHKQNIKHGYGRSGKDRTPEYRAWASMKTRCYNKNIKQYHDWGGRGISVCKRWVNSFTNFLKDMGERPSAKHSLDRKDNDKDYSKKNCRWVLKSIQAGNMRSNRIIDYLGQSKNISEWCRELGVNAVSIRYHLKKGLSFEQAYKRLSAYKQKKAVTQYSLDNYIINEWESLTDASKSLNINMSAICMACKGKNDTAGGFIWKYKINKYENSLHTSLS